MKKLLLLAAFSCSMMITLAQDYKKVQSAVLLNQIETAKTEIDKIASDAKGQNKPETFFWKARVYAALFKNDATRDKYPESGTIAGESLRKSLDNYAALKGDTADLKSVVFDLYSPYFNAGIKNFNSKKWDSAFYSFSKATEYSDIIFGRKWSTSTQPFDTTSILYAGYSAQNGKKMNEASAFYQRLIDSKVSHFGNEPLTDIYKFVLLHSGDAKDSATFNKYFPVCQQVFSKEEWDDYKFDFINKAYTLAEKSALYDRDNATGKLDETAYLHFGDIFFNLGKDEKAALDSVKIADYAVKGREAFKNAYNKNNQNAVAAFNVGVIYYQDFNAFDDKARANIKAQQDINATRPPAEKDPKKKAATDAKFKALLEPLKKEKDAIDKTTMEAVDASIDWIEKSFNILKVKKDNGTLGGTDKGIYSKSVDFLANLYGYKRDKVRGKDPKQYDALDVKYKFYDNLHQ
jgi:hypothetical protein